MGFLSRLLIPRSVRRAAHPGRAVKRAVTPKAIRRARRAAHPLSNAAYGVERSLTTKRRRRRRRTPQDGPLKALWTPRFRYRGGPLYWLLIGIPLFLVWFFWTALVFTAWLIWLLALGIQAGGRAYQRRHPPSAGTGDVGEQA